MQSKRVRLGASAMTKTNPSGSTMKKVEKKVADLMYADPADMLDPTSSTPYQGATKTKIKKENLLKRAAKIEEPETSKHWWESNPVIYKKSVSVQLPNISDGLKQNLQKMLKQEFIWAAMELLASRRREGRRARMLAQVEAWINSIALKISAAAHLSKFIGDSKKNTKLTDYTWDIIVRFNDPIVRHRIKNFMGTEEVRLLDRDFMGTLAHRLVESNCELMKRRIEDRKKWELDRERQLVLDGKLPLEYGPPGISEDPYFKIMSKVIEEVAKRKPRVEVHKVRKPKFDYAMFQTEKTESKVKESASDICIIDDVLPDLNIVEAEKKKCELELKRMRDMIDIVGYERSRYEDIQIKALREAKTVEDMYKMAAKIYMTV